MRTARPARLVVLAIGIATCGASLAVAGSVTPVSSAAFDARPLSPRTTSPASEWAVVEELAFDTDLAEFTAIARDPEHRRHDPRLDWSTDLCSAPLIGNTGRSFDFTASCRHHDFGYRNLHLLERRWGWGSRYWNPTNRERVDRRFLADMLDHCSRRSWWLRWSCRTWAWVYFIAVRTAGGFH